MSSNRPKGVAQNLALAAMLSQIGCVTVVIVIGALLLGLWVDNQFHTKPVFTILLLLLSIPINVYSLVRVALKTAAQFQSDMKEEKKEGRN